MLNTYGSRSGDIQMYLAGLDNVDPEELTERGA
jgi:hypothetical protein